MTTRWLVRRRAMLAGLAALVAGTGFARAGAPRFLRRAVFGEIASSVQMTLSLPGLFKRTDREAYESIDSGFDTTLEYHVSLWEHGTRHRRLSGRVIVVKIRRDPYTRKYVVRTKGSTGWVSRTFEEQADAIEAAVTLDRVRICAADDLVRGSYEDGPFYFVTVFAMRNPIKDEGPSAQSGRRRRRDRDIAWFGRMVDALADERPRAEEIVHVRTNPFYLEAP